MTTPRTAALKIAIVRDIDSNGPGSLHFAYLQPELGEEAKKTELVSPPGQSFSQVLSRRSVAPLSYTERGGAPFSASLPARFTSIKAPKPEYLASHEFIEAENRCAQCMNLDIRGLFRLSRRRYHMGYLSDITSCDQCPLCRLLTAALKNEYENSLSHPYSGQMNVLHSSLAGRQYIL